ncbi:MAG: hypothetical protein KBS35_00035 [Mycoplasma sp.]|nr:hypothetical protein [Candidatus Hennigella equi]
MNKSDFNKNYNVTKILTDKIEIMKQLETFNSKNQAVAFGIRKKTRVTLEDIMRKVDKLTIAINDIYTRLDKYDEMFRQHGWIK